jgi:hypothetical protein
LSGKAPCSAALAGEAEVSRAALDRADDLVGDVLVNVAIAASWGKRDRDQ